MNTRLIKGQQYYKVCKDLALGDLQRFAVTGP